MRTGGCEIPPLKDSGDKTAELAREYNECFIG